MNWLGDILIIAGISLDIFATMEIEGAMLAEVRRKSLIITCTLVTLLQIIFFFGGYIACFELAKIGFLQNAKWIGLVIATIVFSLLGLRLIVKAVRKEFVNESRQEISVRKYVQIIAVTSIYTLFAGCASGLIGTCWILMLITIIICSMLVASGGIYMGYHYGFEAKTVFYVIGAILLWGAAAVILLNHVLANM